MSESEATDAPPRKGRRTLVLLSAAAAVAGAGGGYVAASSGLLSSGGTEEAEVEVEETAPATTFVPIDPILVALGPAGANRHLSFRAQLEVPSVSGPEVAAVMPRIVDVLNSYLRAVDVREFDAPHGLVRLRAQMLRRVQLVVGDGKVNDLLVMEFVLN